MYLQGDLQEVFDALFEMGVIDPVLAMDWKDAMTQLPSHQEKLSQLFDAINAYREDPDRLRVELKNYDMTTLGYLAMEVAREYADYHSRHELH